MAQPQLEQKAELLQTTQLPSTTLALPDASTPADAILVAIDSTNALASITDNYNNAYVIAVSVTGSGGLANDRNAIAYATGIDAGPAPIAITFATTGLAQFEGSVFEYSGIAST